MIADTGDIRNVTGKRIDIAPIGPIPGRTPTNVPTKHPTKQNKRFSGWSPIEKP
jgi:hypothetical protein